MTITYKGKEFSSKAAVARHYGIVKNTFYGRLKRGLTIAEAVEFKADNQSIKVEYKGEVYPSISNLALSLKVRPEYIFGRLKKGMTIEDAVDESLDMIENNKLNNNLRKPFLQVNKGKFKIWGKEYMTINEITKEYNIDDNFLQNEMSNKSIERALIKYKEPEIKRKSREIDSVGRLAKFYGLQPDHIYQRLKIGWSITEAIVVPVRKRHGSQVSYKGEKFVSKASLADKYNIDNYYVTATSSRTGRSWFEIFKEIEEFAAKHELHKFSNPPRTLGAPYQIIFDGIWFESIKQLGEEYGLNPSMYSNKKGKDRIEYIKEFAGEPSGPCFNYSYEWNKIVDSRNN